MRILILNCYSRNALAVINGLDSDHILFGADTKKKSHYLLNPDRLFHSPRLNKIFRYTSQQQSAEQFVADVVEICQKNDIEAIIPTGTYSTNALSEHKQQIESQSGALAIVDGFERLEYLTDKGLMYDICLKLNIPTPKSVVEDDPKNALDRIQNLNFPIAVKPRNDSASKGLHFFSDFEATHDFFSEPAAPNFSDSIVQEVVTGEIHDVAFVAHSGKLVAVYTQHRVVTMHDFGGGGVVNLSTDEPQLKSYAEQIAGHVGWNGVCMIEFIKTDDGHYYLLDSNPKFWGTTQLALDAGLNVVQQTFDVFTKTDTPIVNTTYEVGLLKRWIFPDAVFSWIQKPRKIGRILARIVATFQKHESHRQTQNLKWSEVRHLLGIVFENLSKQ